MRPDVKRGHHSYIPTMDGMETTGPPGLPEDCTPVGSDCKAGTTNAFCIYKYCPVWFTKTSTDKDIHLTF